MFYLSMIIRFNDGTADSPAIYSYTSQNEAVANFHKQLGAWSLKSNVAHIVALVFGEDGAIYKDETYTAEVAPVAE